MKCLICDARKATTPDYRCQPCYDSMENPEHKHNLQETYRTANIRYYVCTTCGEQKMGVA